MRTISTLMLGVALAGCAKKRPEILPPPPPPPPASYEPPPPPPAPVPVEMRPNSATRIVRPPRLMGLHAPIRHAARFRANRPAAVIARSRQAAQASAVSDPAASVPGAPGPATGYGSLSAPASMYRGQSAAVRFAVTLVGGQRDATVIATVPGNVTHSVGRVRVGPIMRAQLTGEGFIITPATPVDVDDAGEMQEAVWNWTIVPVRGPRHYIRVEAWVMRERDGRRVRGPALRYPAFAVGVPVRWFPERAGDALDDSLDWFGRLSTWLKAATALVGVASGFWLALRMFGKAPEPKRPDVSAGAR